MIETRSTSSTEAILNEWAKLKDRLDNHLITLFKSLNIPSKRLHDAMEYVLLSNGKRMRPILIYLTGQALQVPLILLDNIACAVECMHTYSLVHDDLPAMDDDDLRRGKPTCHCVFDEATAILTGDALQALAFQQTLQVNNQLLSAEQKNEMAILLSRSCGAEGMVSGQSMDLEYLNSEALTGELLEQIHQLKTGVLFETCINLAIIAAPDANERTKENLRHFAQHFGLAFQIQDDYLDVYGQTESLGKQQGADERQGKKTYASLYSKEDLEQFVQKIYQQAISFLSQLSPLPEGLIGFTQYLMNRKS